jgi:hypothetical protein
MIHDDMIGTNDTKGQKQKLNCKENQETKIQDPKLPKLKGKQKSKLKALAYLWLRLENHLRHPVMWRKHSESMSYMFSIPLTCSIKGHRIGK